jgi:predicted amidophosphoribosyltransferase
MRIDLCRNCGQELHVTQLCNHCDQPLHFECNNCNSFVDDPIHQHENSSQLPRHLEVNVN